MAEKKEKTPEQKSKICSWFIVGIAAMSAVGISPFHVSKIQPALDLLLSYLTLGIIPFLMGLHYTHISESNKKKLLLGNLVYIGFPIMLVMGELVGALFLL